MQLFICVYFSIKSLAVAEYVHRMETRVGHIFFFGRKGRSCRFLCIQFDPNKLL